MVNEITVKHLSFIYQYHTAMAHSALKDINLRIPLGSFTAIVGRTGSGKSTLIQQFNALLKPTFGTVKVGNILIDHDFPNDEVNLLRRQVGIVFQSPRNQLFGDTVRDNIAFAPRNFGIKNFKIDGSIKKVAKTLNILSLLNKSPFDLSGGQMKKVTIAGALVYKPRILILDEPTMGLDVYSQRKIMRFIAALNRKRHLTVIIVTHQMNWVAKYASQVVVMNNGKILKVDTPRNVFTNDSLLNAAGLLAPFAVRFTKKLSNHGINLPIIPLTNDALSQELSNKIR